MQTEVAERIAEELHTVLSGAERRALAIVPTESLEAYDLYGRGRYLFNRSTTREDREGAVDFFTRAVAEDPEYASPYVGLAEAYNSLWGQGYLSAEEALPLARAAAEKALEIDETLAEAHAALGGVLSVELRLEEAEQAFQRALALNPSSSEVHRQFARLLVRLGRYDESVREGRRAVELDPLSVGTRASLASRKYPWSSAIDSGRWPAGPRLEAPSRCLP